MYLGPLDQSKPWSTRDIIGSHRFLQRVWRMLDIAEYKRRQAPPGVKLTRKAFGKERRYPITNAFKSLI